MGGMSGTRSQPNAGLIASAIVFGLVVIYVIGFFTLGTVGSTIIGPRVLRLRIYQYRWQAELFRPLTLVESALVGQETEAASRN